MPESIRAAASWQFDAIGVPWVIESDAPLAGTVSAVVSETIAAFDRAWSRFREDSSVASLARAGGRMSLPYADEILSLYAEVSNATGGAVNPLVGESLARLGYRGSIPSRPEGAAGVAGRQHLVAPPLDALSWQNEEVCLQAPAMIDIGAFGKGLLVDLVAQAAPEATVIDASGDMLARTRPQRVALEHPYDATKAIGVIEIADESLCASATNRRAWGEGLHHVLDARTGIPVDEVAATWAVAATTMLADATATALFFDGGPEFAARRDVHWVRMFSDGRVQWRLGARLDAGTAEVFV